MKCFLLLFGLFVYQTSVASGEGVFFTNVNSPVYNSRESIKQALKVVADLGLKVVYPCVWNKNNAFWNSTTVENLLGTESLKLYGSRDILQEFIEEARPLGLKVVPWFEYGLKVVLKKGENSKSSHWTDSGRTFYSKGWLTSKKNRVSAMPFKWGVQKGFLNPNHPEVIKFLNSMMRELSAYDIEGILLDDHFSMKPGFGYDKYSNELAAKYNVNGMFPSRKRLMTESITDLLIHLGSTVRASGKRFILSPAGDLNFSKGQWMQDWYRVVQAGVVDQLLMQIYRYNISGFNQLINDRRLNSSSKFSDVGVVILSGLKNNSKMDAGLISSQIKIARKKNMRVNYFYYDSLLVPAKGRETKTHRIKSMRRILRSSNQMTNYSKANNVEEEYPSFSEYSSDPFEDLF